MLKITPLFQIKFACKSRIRELLTEASEVDLTPPSQILSQEELKQQYKIKSRILNYLISCLKGDALLAVRSYDIAPENYDVIIGLLMEKYSFFIRKLLYNERNDRDWKATIEAMERMLRQLEAIGENLEHPSIEISIENKLPAWIVDKLYQLKEESTSWPCVFCNKDHWNNECNIYAKLKLQMERLREITACFKCLRTGHATSDCKKGKLLCFHCKSPHNTLLDSNKEKLDSVTIANSITKKGIRRKKRTLLLFKGINVINPNRPEIQQKALTLFDIGSQLSFISKDLVYRLNLQGTKEMELKIASFSNKIPKTCLNTKTEIGVKNWK
uniref:CCHC-type domain-containing protein n=1 Tax=Wuchereria bancrofti TaxID=6293 RepID=A0AAF5PLT0_WUCBA